MVTKEELIEKYGKCPESRDDLHFFNYVLGENTRGCIVCGVMVNTKTNELIKKNPNQTI